MAIYWPTPCFKGRTFKLCVLTRWDFNLCVCSCPLRGFLKKILWVSSWKRVALIKSWQNKGTHECFVAWIEDNHGLNWFFWAQNRLSCKSFKCTVWRWVLDRGWLLGYGPTVKKEYGNHRCGWNLAAKDDFSIWLKWRAEHLSYLHWAGVCFGSSRILCLQCSLE